MSKLFKTAAEIKLADGRTMQYKDHKDINDIIGEYSPKCLRHHLMTVDTQSMKSVESQDALANKAQAYVYVVATAATFPISRFYHDVCSIRTREANGDANLYIDNAAPSCFLVRTVLLQ